MSRIHSIKDDAPVPAGARQWPVRRRNRFYGKILVTPNHDEPDWQRARQHWQASKPFVLPGILKSSLAAQASAIQHSRQLYKAVLDEQDVDEMLDRSPYRERLQPDFELLCSRFDASDPQEIMSIDFDAHYDDEVVEDTWLRISWLSFVEEDASLRFRFSFGMEGYEDVSLDLKRQRLAARLEEKIFPESCILTGDRILNERLATVAGCHEFEYLERIVYFNAPNGGAQFHHDAEKGHLGVVYAQVTGQTFWLALSKQELIGEIIEFMSQAENRSWLVRECEQGEELDAARLDAFDDAVYLDQALNDLFHPELNILLNQSTVFFDQLLAKQFAWFLEPGDIMLLPQQSLSDCAWHSVFCLGEDAGEALSFAIKPVG